jgi:hypothetical protein
MASSGTRQHRAADRRFDDVVPDRRPLVVPDVACSAAADERGAGGGGLRALLVAGVNAPFNDNFAPVALLGALQTLEEDLAVVAAAKITAAASARKKERPSSAKAAVRSYADGRQKLRASPARPKSAGAGRQAAAPLRMVDAAGEWASSIDDGRRQEAARISLLADVVRTNSVHGAPRPRSAASRRAPNALSTSGVEAPSSETALGNFFMGFTVQETHN